MKVRLTRLCGSLVDSLTNRLYRAGEVYECSDNEAKIRLSRGEAEAYVEGDADYLPPDGVEAHVIVNKTIREQTTPMQSRRKAAAV